MEDSRRRAHATESLLCLQDVLAAVGLRLGMTEPEIELAFRED